MLGKGNLATDIPPDICVLLHHQSNILCAFDFKSNH